MKRFFQNTVVKIFTLVAFALFVGSVFLFKDFYVRQVNKVKSVWNVYKGDEAYAKGELKNALKYYNIALKEYPGHSQARCNLANIYVSFEDYTSAVEQYTLALKYRPNYMQCRMDLGIIQAEKLSNFDEAIDQYNKVAKTNKILLNVPFIFNNADPAKVNKGYAYYNMGLAYRAKSLFTPRDKLLKNPHLLSAVEAYKKSIKINTDDYNAIYNLALTHHLLGNKKEAGLMYCKAIETMPLNYEAHFNLAILLDGMGYFDEAINEFNKAGSLMNNTDHNQSIYLNELLNDSYKKKEIERQMSIEKGIVILGEDSKTDENKDKVEFEETNVVIYKGKTVLKEESEGAFLRKMKKCESKKIFKEMS